MAIKDLTEVTYLPLVGGLGGRGISRATCDGGLAVMLGATAVWYALCIAWTAGAAAAVTAA